MVASCRFFPLDLYYNARIYERQILKCPSYHMWIGCCAHPASCEMGAKVKGLWSLGTLTLGPTQPVSIWYQC